jgi:diacylglycerol kinase (ATP)
VSSSGQPTIVFVNKSAGRGRAGNYAHRVRTILEDRGFAATFVETSSRNELQTLATKAIASGARLLVAMGGDGTLQGLAQATLAHDVTLGILPSGGGNDFARALGLGSDPGQAAATLLDGHARPFDVLRAKTADGKEHVYLGGGGIGLDAAAAQYAADHYHTWPGRWRYVASALRAYRHFKPLHVRLEFPENDLPCIEADVLLAGALNTPTLGAGLRLAPEGKIDDGMLDVAVLKYLPFRSVLRLVPRVLRNGEVRSPALSNVRARRIRIVCDRPSVFHGDGEILGPAPVEVEVLPNAIRVVVPRLASGTASL